LGGIYVKENVPSSANSPDFRQRLNRTDFVLSVDQAYQNGVLFYGVLDVSGVDPTLRVHRKKRDLMTQPFQKSKRFGGSGMVHRTGDEVELGVLIRRGEGDSLDDVITGFGGA
jgi:hypothetical protein